ncbi:MAG: response regulator [Planctomycetes bacterium]|nr:response regulator [Planctomycetota bacterium]
MKCLLVDDEPGIREGMAMLLRRRGHEVVTAADCAAAAEALAAGEFDVVVTDWRLPDGVAAAFLDRCPCPAVAVSGHPEEVTRVGAVREVLGKPVTPTRLIECLQQLAAAAHPVAPEESSAADGPRLVPDVAAIVHDVLAQLPSSSDVECVDDGTFVVLRAALRPGQLPGVRNLGGDLRIVTDDERRWLELRLCRDGSPEAGLPVSRIDGDWPQGDRICLDCDGLEVGAERFVAWLDRAGRERRAGRRVCLLNVPPALLDATEGWETTHDMPMREPVGPCLPAEMAELWS